MAKKHYGNYQSRNQDQQTQRADARGSVPGFQDYDYGSNDDWRRRGFDYRDYYRYIVNENPDEPDYSRRRGQPDYRGRGPKNYHRSSERIREDVSDRLTSDPRLDASGIDVRVGDNNEVILSGIAPDRASKRRAYNLAESIPGVSNVENRIRINME